MHIACLARTWVIRTVTELTTTPKIGTESSVKRTAPRMGRPQSGTQSGTRSTMIYVGCAGWALRKESAAEFAIEGSHLVRYARRLSAVEVNSTFYRPHRPKTFEKWAAAVPRSFCFSVKVPKWITHERRLKVEREQLAEFVNQVTCLGPALGILLVQLPPSLAFDRAVAMKFFEALQLLTPTRIACEPRHKSWFKPVVDDLLKGIGVARVAADPAVVPAASEPGGADECSYYRLHGSPTIYYSSYAEEELELLAGKLNAAHARGRDAWCIFDNTAAGAAIGNALSLLARTTLA
jgi:uncharacterized protein YecE (DUF72 family)